MYFIYFVILLTIFQEATFGFLGVSGVSLFFLRTVADLTPILLFFYAVTRNSLERRPFILSGSGYERLFFLFFIYSLIISLSTLSSNLAANIAEIIVINRFVFLAMTIPMIVNTEIKIVRLLRFLWLVILAQVFIGAMQQFGGPPVIDFFRPNDYSNFLTGSERSFTSNRGLSRQMIIGTVGDFLSFGYIMCAGIIFLLARQRLQFRTHLMLLILITMVFLSGSRTIFLSSMLVVLFTFFTKAKPGTRILLLVSGLISTPPAILFLINRAAGTEFEYSAFLSIFRPEFLESLMNQRLGHAFLYLPQFVVQPDAIFGLSPDRVHATQFANTNLGTDLPYIFMATFNETLEDFYPAALITYYGLVGTTLFYFMYFRILLSAWRRRHHQNDLTAYLARLVLFFVAIVHLLSLANQSFENRSMALFLWVTVGMYGSITLINRNPRTNIQGDQVEVRNRSTDTP